MGPAAIFEKISDGHIFATGRPIHLSRSVRVSPLISVVSCPFYSVEWLYLSRCSFRQCKQRRAVSNQGRSTPLRHTSRRKWNITPPDSYNRRHTCSWRRHARKTIFHFRSQWPWPLTFRPQICSPMLLLFSAMFSLNRKFLQLSYFQKIWDTGRTDRNTDGRTDGRPGCNA